jgi:hypothetical protein
MTTGMTPGMTPGITPGITPGKNLDLIFKVALYPRNNLSCLRQFIRQGREGERERGREGAGMTMLWVFGYSTDEEVDLYEEVEEYRHLGGDDVAELRREPSWNKILGHHVAKEYEDCFRGMFSSEQERATAADAIKLLTSL